MPPLICVCPNNQIIGNCTSNNCIPEININNHLNLCMVSTRSDTNWAAKSQKKVRSLKKFQIYKEEELYYPVTAKLICDFVFAYADCCFSDVAAHLGCTGYDEE